jgi:hypothetical protein
VKQQTITKATTAAKPIETKLRDIANNFTEHVSKQSTSAKGHTEGRSDSTTKTVLTAETFARDIRLNINDLSDSTFKDLVQTFDANCGAPTEYIITGTLAALSGAIGKQAYFDFTPSLRIYLNIWAAIIGRSTVMRKTSAINETIRPLVELNTAKFKEFQQAQKRFDALSQNTDASSEPKREYVLYPNDSTNEAFQEILRESKRGLIVHQELGSLLKQLNRGYSGDSKEFLTAVYDVPYSYEVARITRGNLLMERPYLSMLAATTREWLLDNMQETDLRSGFYARWIYCIRHQNEKEFVSFFDLASRTREHSRIDANAIFARLVSIDETSLSYAPAAIELHKQYEKQFWTSLQHLADNEELSFKARLLVTSFKIAGILALTNNHHRVEESDVRDAILLTNYYKLNSEELLRNELTRTALQGNAKTVMEILQRQPSKKMKHRDLLPLTHLDAEPFREAIEYLEQIGKLEIAMTDNTRGKKGNIYVVQ